MRLKFYRGLWYAVWLEDGATRRVSLRTTDRDVATAALADLKRPPVDNTVAAIYAAYQADKGKERAKHAWHKLGPMFGALHPDQVTRTLCRRYTAARRKTVSDGTIHVELTYLRAALRHHDPNTPAVVEFPAKPPPRDHHLSREQYATLLEATKETHVRLFMQLAIATGGRSGAILALTWDRVDFARGLIKLGDGAKRIKGRATVPMNDTVRAALMTAAEQRTSAHVVEFGGKPIARIVKGFRAASRAAGMPWCTPHVLRHTAAVWMAESGIPIAEISQYLGHSDSMITERVYSRYGPDYLRRAASALE